MTDKRPNIVVVVADDTTPSYHGCYGGPTPTPNIDGIAANGARFDRAYCCASLCNPSRWTLFTGLYTGRSRWVSGDTPAGEPYCVGQNGMLDPETPTLGKALQQAGYFTGHVGKWHSRFATADFGFEEPKHIAGDADDPAVDAEIRLRQANAQEVVRVCGGFDVADRVQWGNLGAVAKGIDSRLCVHNVPWMTDGAVDFIDQAADRDQPFYLHIANSVPHSPDCHQSLGQDHRYSWGGQLEQAPRSHPDDETVFERMRAAGLQIDGPLAGINAGMIMLDDQIGAVLRRLEARGMLDNTIVIYTADHGVPGKGSCHHIGVHMPFVLSWPAQIPAGQVHKGLLSYVDMVPTLLEAAGTSMPDRDGMSVLASLREYTSLERRHAFTEMGQARSVISDRYQLISFRYSSEDIACMQADDCPRAVDQAGRVQGGFAQLNAPFQPQYFDADQLYDVQLDPYQSHNLIDDPTRAAVVVELKQALWQITDTLPGGFPTEPHAFRQTSRYAALMAARREQLAEIEHYPPGGRANIIWHQNIQDPVLTDG